MARVFGEWDREWFNRCERAWDFGSPVRQNLEPHVPARGLSCESALREALAVYYYPAMWDWQPFVVRPLAHKAFSDSLDQQRADLIEEPVGSAHVVALGAGILDHYFEWAPLVDRFAPLLVATEFQADVVDPNAPSQELVLAGGEAVSYRGRIHLLIVDEDDRYWIMQHRLVNGPWDDLELLSLDDHLLAAMWGWERFALMPLTGVIVNELRAELPSPNERVAAGLSDRRRLDADRKRGSVGQNIHRPRRPDAVRLPPGMTQEGNRFFRRTQIPVSPARRADFAVRLGSEALRMTCDLVDIPPRPVRDNCAACSYRAPCLALNDGSDPGPLLDTGFRQRRRQEEFRLGGLFGLNPNQMRVREHQPRRRTDR